MIYHKMLGGQTIKISGTTWYVEILDHWLSAIRPRSYVGTANGHFVFDGVPTRAKLYISTGLKITVVSALELLAMEAE